MLFDIPDEEDVGAEPVVDVDDGKEHGELLGQL